ncbi:hypothetical protein [Taibaiella soli]|uniref:DUF5681 domain-containing protein n=1 Tax=Taibaiella soli TaxID=1649169 RepID=A0A2W2AB19_9BACT|nr:hypothetical protein [Taibaiella soli]PZF70782.1 hypothetical protein DN068_21715 [Taibaiella soli]
MGLKRGQTNNIHGRPKGAENKVKADLKGAIKLFLGNNIGRLQDDFDSLSPKDRLLFFEKLLKYVVAAQAAVGDEADKEGIMIQGIWYSEKPHLSDDQFAELLNSVKNAT